MTEIKGQVVEGNVFIYPKDDELTMPDLLKFIGKNIELSGEYKHNLETVSYTHLTKYKAENIKDSRIKKLLESCEGMFD